MGNSLFREARKAVGAAKQTSPAQRKDAINTAKNALTSAYANSSMAEKEQLRAYQDELNSIK